EDEGERLLGLLVQQFRSHVAASVSTSALARGRPRRPRLPAALSRPRTDAPSPAAPADSRTRDKRRPVPRAPRAGPSEFRSRPIGIGVTETAVVAGPYFHQDERRLVP